MKKWKDKKKMADKESEMSTQATTPYNQWDYRIETRGLLDKHYHMGYQPGLHVLAAVLIDDYGSQDETYDRFQLWITKQVDPTLVSDYQAMADALPVDSPRKAAAQYLADMVALAYDSYINPPDWSDLP